MINERGWKLFNEMFKDGDEVVVIIGEPDGLRLVERRSSIRRDLRSYTTTGNRILPKEDSEGGRATTSRLGEQT